MASSRQLSPRRKCASRAAQSRDNCRSPCFGDALSRPPPSRITKHSWSLLEAANRCRLCGLLLHLSDFKQTYPYPIPRLQIPYRRYHTTPLTSRRNSWALEITN
jgi:hypothetical protein